MALDFGIRGAGIVPLDRIATCTVGGVGDIGPGELWNAAGAERANVVIALTGMTTLQTVAWGSAREVTAKFVVIYADQPALFAAAVAAALTRGARQSVPEPI